MNEVNIEMWKQANQVYAELMDLTVSDALHQLSQMESLDDQLKSLVLTLISSGNQPSQYFKNHIGSSFQLDDMQQHAYHTGDQVGGYELQEELGVGGMAKVYKAIKLGAESQKPVAIKIFNHRGVSSLLLSRFAVEQDILSGLTHPNIVNMHHGGNSDEGVPFIVMELIEDAIDIDQYAIKHQVSLRKKIKWMVAAARAIAHAHNNLIVHRDIKPSNLLIDAKGQLKVVDFGIAKLLTKEDTPQKTTIMALTPLYAAPEQINSGQISVTTDVFSLGAVCLSLLIEDLPLPADRLLKSCAEDEAHLWQVLKHQIKDKDLRNILNRALQQNPNKRYRNMESFADDMNAWLSSKPVMATPDSWLYRISKFASRRRALFATMVALVLTLALSVGVLSWQYNNTKKEAQKALEVKNFMLNVFAVTNPDVNQGEDISALDLLQKARVDIESSHQSNPSLKAELMLAIGTAFYQVGEWEQANEVLQEAQLLAPENLEITITHAEVLVALKHASELKELMAKSPRLAESQIRKDQQPRRLRLLAAAELLDNELDSAHTLLEQAQQIDLKDNDLASYLEDVIALVQLAYQRSEYQAGIELAEQTIPSYESEFPPAYTGMLRLKNELSVLYTKTGQFEKSQQLLEQMVALEQRYLGDEHPELISTMISLSESYYSQGKLDLAHEMANKAHELTLSKFGAGHPKLIESLTGIASVVFVKGNYEEALLLMNEAIGISVATSGAGHAESLMLKRNYATALSALRRNDEAKVVLQEVLDLQRETLGEDHSDTLFTKLTIVRVLGALGEHEDAVEVAEQVAAVFTADPSLTGPIRSNAIFALGFAYFEAGQHESAIKIFRQMEVDGIESEATANYMVMCKTMARSLMATEAYDEAAVYAQKSIDLSNRLIGPENIRTTKVRLLLAQIWVANDQFQEAAQLLAELQPLVVASDSRDKEAMLAQMADLEAQLRGE